MGASISRLKKIAARFGLLEAADKWHAELNHAPGDAVSYASCVCAAAFDAHRANNPAMAERICNEVWCDDELANESRFRERRDVTLEALDNLKCGPFRPAEVRNRYAALYTDIVVVLICAHCGNRVERRYPTLINSFTLRCKKCGAFE